MLSTAQKDAGFETPISQAVYSKDEFELDVAEARVKHVIKNPADRGVLLGAYCIAPHKTRKPVVTWVSYEEYAKSWGQRNPVWRSNPAEMIRKVAESQSLRRQYANTGLSAVYVKDELGPGTEGCEIVEAETVPPQVTREEVDALIARALAAGLTIDGVKMAFSEATGRMSLEGWSRDRAEFDRWVAKVDAWIATQAEVTEEQAKDKAKKTEAREKPKAPKPEMEPSEDKPEEKPVAPTGAPYDLISPEQKQRIVELCCKLQEPGGVPLAWLKKTMGIDVAKLTQGAAADLILHLEELVSSRGKGQQALL